MNPTNSLLENRISILEKNYQRTRKLNYILILFIGINSDFPRLMLFDNSTVERLSLSFNNNNNPYIGLYDKSGTIRSYLSINQNNTTYFKLFDKNGNLRTAIGGASTTNNRGTTYHPESSIWLFNENGNSIWSAP